MNAILQGTCIRAAVGLIAAYAIALQTLFAAFAPLPANASGVDFGQVICFGSGNAPASDDGGAPAPAPGKLHCVLCVASGAAAVLPEPVACPVARSVTLSQPAPVSSETLPAPPAARSGPSRAPPVTL